MKQPWLFEMLEVWGMLSVLFIDRVYSVKLGVHSVNAVT